MTEAIGIGHLRLKASGPASEQGPPPVVLGKPAILAILCAMRCAEFQAPALRKFVPHHCHLSLLVRHSCLQQKPPGAPSHGLLKQSRHCLLLLLQRPPRPHPQQVLQACLSCLRPQAIWPHRYHQCRHQPLQTVGNAAEHQHLHLHLHRYLHLPRMRLLGRIGLPLELLGLAMTKTLRALGAHIKAHWAGSHGSGSRRMMPGRTQVPRTAAGRKVMVANQLGSHGTRKMKKQMMQSGKTRMLTTMMRWQTRLRAMTTEMKIWRMRLPCMIGSKMHKRGNGSLPGSNNGEKVSGLRQHRQQHLVSEDVAISTPAAGSARFATKT